MATTPLLSSADFIDSYLLDRHDLRENLLKSIIGQQSNLVVVSILNGMRDKVGRRCESERDPLRLCRFDEFARGNEHARNAT